MSLQCERGGLQSRRTHWDYGQAASRSRLTSSCYFYKQQSVRPPQLAAVHADACVNHQPAQYQYGKDAGVNTALSSVGQGAVGVSSTTLNTSRSTDSTRNSGSNRENEDAVLDQRQHDQQGTLQRNKDSKHQKHLSSKRRQHHGQDRMQRWQKHQQALQQAEHRMQQRQQLLQQHLHRCTHWKQLLPLAAGPVAQADPAWVAAVAIRAAQLQPSHVVGAAVLTNSNGSAIDAFCMTALEAAMTAATLSVGQHHTEQLQHRHFIQQLIAILGTQLSAAAATAAAPGPPAALLCNLLSHLSSAGVQLPLGWVQEQLLPYIRTRYSRMQPEEVLALTVGMAVIQRAGLDVQIGLQKRLLRIVVSEVRPTAPVQEVSRALWAGARLKWSPSQQWVQQAAAVLVMQVKQCNASDLALALWGLASLGCDMELLKTSLQQPQQRLWGTSSHGIEAVANGAGSGNLFSVSSMPGSEQNSDQQKQLWTVQQQVSLQRPVAHPSEQLLQAVYMHAAGFSPQELLCILWACAELQLLPQQPVLQHLLSYCLKPVVLQQYTGADLSGLLWFLAKMQHQQDAQQWQQQQPNLSCKQWVVQQRHQRQLLQHQPGLRSGPSEFTRVAAVSGVLSLLDAMLYQLPLVRIQDLVTALRSVAFLGVQPPRSWVGRVLYHTQPLLSSLSAAHLVQLLQAVANLGYVPSEHWLQSFYAASQPMVVRISQRENSAFTADSDSDKGTLSLQHLNILAGAMLKLSRSFHHPLPGQKPPAAWLSALAQATLPVLASAESPEQLSFWGRVMHRFSSLAGEAWPGPGQQWWLKYVEVAQPLLARARPFDLRSILEVLTHKRQQCLIGQLPHSWIEEYVKVSRAMFLASVGSSCSITKDDVSLLPDVFSRQINSSGAHEKWPLNAADVVLIGKCFAQLGVVPDMNWQQVWLAAAERADSSMTASLRDTLRWTLSRFRVLLQCKGGDEQHIV